MLTEDCRLGKQLQYTLKLILLIRHFVYNKTSCSSLEKHKNIGRPVNKKDLRSDLKELCDLEGLSSSDCKGTALLLSFSLESSHGNSHLVLV